MFSVCVIGLNNTFLSQAIYKIKEVMNIILLYFAWQ